MIEVEMPEDVEPGAVEIRVEGSNVDPTYGPEPFTAWLQGSARNRIPDVAP